MRELGWYHSIELPDGEILEGLIPVERLRWRLAQFPIPQDLRGKRVLDIGAWDGWFSFEMEKRGAEVVAVDFTSQTRFRVAKELLGSKVEYRTADICRMTPAEWGKFDIVLFLGVLYHVKNPVLALENVCALSRDLACVESFVTDDGSENLPRMEFYEGTELRGQFDNWVGPNMACLLAFCRTAGFARVEPGVIRDERAHVTCWRNWEASGALAGKAPYITCIENAVTRDHEFAKDTDEYAGIWFESEFPDLTIDNVYPAIGSYGARPVGVSAAGSSGWHLIVKVPPGLDAGYHRVRLRAKDGEWSNTAQIAVGIPVAERRRRPAAVTGAGGNWTVTSVTDSRTYELNRVKLGDGSAVSVWVKGLAEETNRGDVMVRLDGTDLPAIYVGGGQVNAILPTGIHPGKAFAQLVVNEEESAVIEVELVRD